MNPGLRQRVITAIIFGAIFIPLLLYASWSAQLLFLLILLLMQFEYSKIVFANYSEAFPMIMSSTIICFAPFAWHLWQGTSPELWQILLIISILFCSINTILLYTTKKVSLSYQPFLLNGLLYLSIPIFVLILKMSEFESLHLLIMALFVIIWVSDSAAYFIGKAWGKTKLFPSISPKKSLQGYIGGLIGALLTGYIISLFMQDLSLKDWLITGGIVWLAGSTGDLVESSFKRQYNIKDSGNALPGHGGFLDRFDSFIFSLPFFLAYLYL